MCVFQSHGVSGTRKADTTFVVHTVETKLLFLTGCFNCSPPRGVLRTHSLGMERKQREASIAQVPVHLLRSVEIEAAPASGESSLIPAHPNEMLKPIRRQEGHEPNLAQVLHPAAATVSEAVTTDAGSPDVLSSLLPCRPLLPHLLPSTFPPLHLPPIPTLHPSLLHHHRQQPPRHSYCTSTSTPLFFATSHRRFNNTINNSSFTPFGQPYPILRRLPLHLPTTISI